MRRTLTILLVLATLPSAAAGCSGPRRNMAAIRSYYAYDFTSAREALRADAERNNNQVVLNNLRLGLAALADGDEVEAEQALGRAYELLSTAGLNRDRTTAAILFHEGVKIWKGEPFEQALAYYWMAALYATLGDWENVRAASANALFRLTDFGADQHPRSLVRRAAADPAFLRDGYTAADTSFALGFLMQAIGSDLSGANGRDEQLLAALKIDPDVAPIADAIRSRRYDTLLIVDYGKGPTKIAYGPDEALVRFVAQERNHGDLVVRADRVPVGLFEAVCDINTMAVDHRWNNLEDIRRAKSTIGNLLLTGGAITAAYGGYQQSEAAALVGLGLMLLGALMKESARGDTRYLEFAPQTVYLAPVELETTCELKVSITGDEGATVILPDFDPGEPGAPRAVYLRLHGLDSPDPGWLMTGEPLYGNDVSGPRIGDLPWILGGHDVSTPNHNVLEAYQLGGYLPDFTAADLQALYRAEGIRIGPGDVSTNRARRHILDGGRSLFTPQAHSMGYKRLMFSEHRPYRPSSERVRTLYQQLQDESETLRYVRANEENSR